MNSNLGEAACYVHTTEPNRIHLFKSVLSLFCMSFRLRIRASDTSHMNKHRILYAVMNKSLRGTLDRNPTANPLPLNFSFKFKCITHASPKKTKILEKSKQKRLDISRTTV
ncbi:hypothetical protein GcM1_215021 [Golovinomyces cichoracearum]|uniref:Uncharacterized protein n=1 Tax=Golovinomyces cichoracearum TaxID=62708 RepID=A0A420ITN8_9PEZI|nr:hypothetical protein GcM1_215021 [Golovinomyces cichoracearum]